MHSSGDAVMDMCAAVCVPCCVAAGFHYHGISPSTSCEHQTSVRVLVLHITPGMSDSQD